MQQQQQQQHQQHNLQHPAFASGNPAQHNLNLFGHNQSGFQSNAAIAGGIGGAGLAGGAGLGGVSGGTGLDGQEARMRFAHGAQLQEAAMGRGQEGAKGPTQRIREVWKTNLHQEMALLRSLVEQYPYISMVSILFSHFRHFFSLSIFSNTSSARRPRLAQKREILSLTRYLIQSSPMFALSERYYMEMC